MTQSQSERFHNRFFEVYPGMKAWHSRTRELATEGLSEARSRLGRRRLLPQGEDAWWHRFSRGLNSPIQGGAADVLKTALVRLGDALPASAFIVSNIHDEIIVECDEADSASVRGILEDVMTRAMKEIYPEVACEVEAKIGSTWDEAK